MVVSCFCNVVAAAGSVWCSSRVTSVAVLNRCCGSEMLVLFMVDFVLDNVVADLFD